MDDFRINRYKVCGGPVGGLPSSSLWGAFGRFAVMICHCNEYQAVPLSSVPATLVVNEVSMAPSPGQC